MKSKLNRFLRLLIGFILLASFLSACDDAEFDTESIPDDGSALVEEAEEPEPVEDPGEAEQAVEEEAPEADTSQPAGNPTAVQPDRPDTWLVMLYQNADDEVLEEDIFIDLNEAEIVGSTDQVTIVSQLDRYSGAFEGDGDWTSTRRYLVTQDSDLNAIQSEEIADLGEVDSGSKDSLVDFAVWAIQTYPAGHYALILSDHGAGWQGGWNDDDPVSESAFRLQDIDDALGTILTTTGIDAFEFIGFDACLMGQVEVMSAIAPHARYAVASEETEPALGWAYASFLKALNANPAMNGEELGRAVVSSYIQQDFRVTDAEARAVFAEGETSAEAVAADLIRDTTLSAVDLQAMQNLNAALNQFAVALSQTDQEAVAEARTYAQAYTSVFGDDTPPSYIDLGHFVDLLLESSSAETVSQSGQAVKAALQAAVLAEKHGAEKPGSSGLSIYFPNSELFSSTVGADADPQYGVYAGRFAAASLWDDYLTFHYTGEPFDPAQADLAALTPAQSAQSDFSQAASESAPAPDAQVSAPGSGEISIAPLETSADTISSDDSLILSTTVSGANIGYIYYYVSYYDEQSGSYLTADMDFISADTTKEIGGIYYPDWGSDAAIDIEFEWEPTLYYMSDGDPDNDQFAFFEPEIYGVDSASTTYSVRGVYRFADSGNEINAVIRFSGDGDMQDVYGFNGENGSGAPREIVPQPGDSFTITEEWLDFTTDSDDGEFVDYEGGTLTFGDSGFEMVPYYAYAGEYTLGVIVEDLNGNRSAEYIEVTVSD